MQQRRSPWHWVIAVLVALILGAVTSVAAWSWYLSGALATDVSISDDAVITVVAPFPIGSLLHLVVPTVLAIALCVGTGIALYNAFGRRRAPALVASSVGPIIAFVLQLGAVAYARFIEGPVGADYLGDRPVVLAGYAVVFLVPAVASVVAVVAVSRGKSAPGRPAPPA